MDPEDARESLFVEDDRPVRLPPVVAQPPPAEFLPPTDDESAVASPRRATFADLLAALLRIERSLDDIRRALSATVREDRHAQFSLARLVGAILQALVVGWLLWGVSDWAFGEPSETLRTKLGFAAVFQLVALTAFLVGRERNL